VLFLCWRLIGCWVRKLIRNTYLITYLLTPFCRVLQKLTGFQLVKKLPALCGTRSFITAFTSARNLSLSWASSIRFMHPSHFLEIHFNIILPFTPGCKCKLLLLLLSSSSSSSSAATSIFYANKCPTRCNYTQFILSVSCSTCFGWFLHPSSGPQIAVSTVSGASQPLLLPVGIVEELGLYQMLLFVVLMMGEETTRNM